MLSGQVTGDGQAFGDSLAFRGLEHWEPSSDRLALQFFVVVADVHYFGNFLAQKAQGNVHKGVSASMQALIFSHKKFLNQKQALLSMECWGACEHL